MSKQLEIRLISLSLSASFGELTALIELLDHNGIKLEEKDAAKLSTMAGDNGMICRDDFSHFAKHSKTVKLLIDKLERARSRPATPKTSRAKKPDIDQAKAAFKAIDKDHSGFIDAEEFGTFCSKISPEKKAELMKKLDKDGDGKIDLEEFRLLFKHKLSH